MGIAESLKALGILTENASSVAEGIGKLVIPLSQKRSLLLEFLQERKLDLTPDLEGLLGE